MDERTAVGEMQKIEQKAIRENPAEFRAQYKEYLDRISEGAARFVGSKGRMHEASKIMAVADGKPSRSATSKPVPKKSNALSEEERHLCAELGVDESTYLEQKRADEAAKAENPDQVKAICRHLGIAETAYRVAEREGRDGN